jgi:hypothetical protein
MELLTMATDALPAVLAPDRAAAETSALAPARKVSLPRRMFDALVAAQTRRAEREIARLLRHSDYRRPHDV